MSAHSVMFHHFHGKGHNKSQGSIDAAAFSELLHWLSKNYEIVSPETFRQKASAETLDNSMICLSFDDGLLAQYQVATPILDKFKIKAFFFIYSSIFTDKPDPIEIYRYFRTNAFGSISEFYKFFNSLAEDLLEDHYKSAKLSFESSTFLNQYTFYTEEDKWFRYLRDEVLTRVSYSNLMNSLMKQKSFDFKSITAHLWMNKHHIKCLSNSGHEIGLHSHSHPTRISYLSKEEQYNEYSENIRWLSKITNAQAMKSVSHPCGDYNVDTLEILYRLGITIGFRSDMAQGNTTPMLEIPRKDHSLLIEEIIK